MKLLYEASNTVEAHMILNLLEQAGLSARIDGEYLQGGVGELQTMGIVRVMVKENDYPDAKSIIQEWDAAQPALDTKKTIAKKQSNFGTGIIGFIFGIAAMAILIPKKPLKCRSLAPISLENLKSIQPMME
jgi:hypothetical protein